MLKKCLPLSAYNLEYNSSCNYHILAILKTKKIYLEDFYCFKNVANIVLVTENSIVPDQTCMYPGGGGQPCDTGELVLSDGRRIVVQSVSKKDNGGILHHSQDPIPEDIVGMPCIVRLDAERRLAFMRYHTALHVLNTVMLREFGGWITGVGIGVDGSRIDFKLDNYEKSMSGILEEKVNTVLCSALPVKSYFVSEDEFNQRPDLLRTLEARPPVEDGMVRVVEVEGFESQACGGTHVSNTIEVGRLSVTRVDNKGRNNRRFHLLLTAPDAGE